MDIGLEKLIEMIEQRLGRWAANILLGLIVFAVIGVSLHLIGQYLLAPLWGAGTVIVPWIKATIGPVNPKLPAVSHFSVPWKWVIISVIEIPMVGFLVIVLGRTARLLLEDHRIAKDVRDNPMSIWTANRAKEEIEEMKKRRLNIL